MFVLTNFVFTGAVTNANPLLTVIGYVLVVDGSSLRPWQILSVALAALSIFIVFRIDYVAKEFSYPTQKADNVLLKNAERKFGWIERLVRFRLVPAILFWLIIGGQTLLYFTSLKCWFTVPANVESGAQWVYGDRTPQARCDTAHRLIRPLTL
jgi:hypothetical protein